MRRNLPRIAAVILTLTLATTAARAWSDHGMATYRVLSVLPEVAAAAPVAAEPLADFLRAEEAQIEATLAQTQTWAAGRLEAYPPLPAALRFVADPARSDGARQLAFLRALRVALDARFALYVQPDRWLDVQGSELPVAAVVTPGSAVLDHRFLALQPGEQVAPLAVVASAADEPDYGLDIGIWTDSRTPWGKEMGMGPLPFGNPALVFATQAPMHMGFYHEDRILYLAAPQLRRTYPQLRHHQFAALAQLAFRSGHPYWGWRFTGLALHYLQDLTQPYHATVMPGASTLRMLGISVLAKLGMQRPWDEAIVLLSNRHLAAEAFQSDLIREAARVRRAGAIETALQDVRRDGTLPAWSDDALRTQVSARAHAAAPALNDAVLAALPDRLVLDPGFDYGVHEREVDLLREIGPQGKTPGSRAALEAAIADRMADFGAFTRAAVRAIVGEVRR